MFNKKQLIGNRCAAGEETLGNISGTAAAWKVRHPWQSPTGTGPPGRRTDESHVELVSAARLQLGGAQGGNLKRGDRRERKLQAVMKQFISISKIKCEADPPVLSLWIWKKKKTIGTAQMTDSSGVDPSRKTGDTRCGNCDKNHYPSFSFVFGSIF